MKLGKSRFLWANFLLTATSLCAFGCSQGGAGIDDDTPPDPPPVFDMAIAVPPDAAVPLPPADMSVPIVPMVKGCTWRDRFQELYGHAWNGADVAFVTLDGVLTRGIDQLDIPAQKSQVPDVVLVKGRSSHIKEIQLLAPGASTVLASRTGAYVYGLGYAMWLDANGYGEPGMTEATLIRQFGMETATYQQLVGIFRVLTKNAEKQVTAADLADFQTAAAKLMSAIESGSLTFALGTGHGADYSGTAQTVNGKRFSFQLSDGFGLDPQLGFQRDGVWGPLWLSYSPSGGWASTAPGMQPKCGGCTVDHFAGTTYQFCDGPSDRATAEIACQAHGGDLATVNDLFTNEFLRGLAPNAGAAWIGLNDMKTMGQYVWASGTPATYTNWGQGQPDHWMNQEHCVQLSDSTASTQWNDVSCTSQQTYLCQFPY